jgi:hypothetical protein
MLTRRRLLSSGPAGVAALLGGCAYRPPGYADPSLVHAPWLVEPQKLLFVLEGGDGDPALPARPAIWDFVRRSGIQYRSPERDRWHYATMSQDGEWIVGIVHEYDARVDAWPNARNRPVICRRDGSGFKSSAGRTHFTPLRSWIRPLAGSGTLGPPASAATTLIDRPATTSSRSIWRTGRNGG